MHIGVPQDARGWPTFERLLVDVGRVKFDVGRVSPTELCLQSLDTEMINVYVVNWGTPPCFLFGGFFCLFFGWQRRKTSL